MTSAYTNVQLQNILSRIRIPAQYHLDRHATPDLEFLIVLHTHILTAVPYENLLLHYGNRKVSLEPQDLYEKIVKAGRGRGGYCMENSLFYMHLLRGLGFQTYIAGVRIRRRIDGIPQGEYVGWVHIVNIVTFADGSKYMVDVGFGGDGATAPIPLVEGYVTCNMGSQDVRLVRDHIPQQVARSSETKLWIYQYRNRPDLPWNSFYAFAEFEFLPPDFEIMNWYTGSNPESAQTFTVLVVSFLKRANADAPGGQEVYGKRMLVDGTVKENLGGRTHVVQQCNTEYERTEALRTIFGITLTEAERSSIVGTTTDLGF